MHESPGQADPRYAYPPYGTPGHPPYGAPGHPPYGVAPGYPPAPYVVLAPKSVGIAILLSIVWSGAGNLYAGQTGAGAALMVVDAFFRGLSMLLAIFIITIPLLILTIPIILVTFVVALATSVAAVDKYNNRLVLGAR